MRSQARKQRGVAAVEFGLLAVILITIAFGATEFGRAFYQYNTVLKAARAAAREFTQPNPALTAAARKDRAQCLAAYGHYCVSGGTNVAILEGLTKEMVVLDDPPLSCAFDSHPCAYVCATISGFQFVSYVPWIVPSITFAPISACLRQLSQ